MNDPGLTTAPLTVQFEVGASVGHAFATWVERAALWWPRDHTMSGEPAEIVFEPTVGGRIYERDAAGSELVWGEILVWDPPTRVEYLWHLFFSRAEATRVAVTFTPVGRSTVVRLVQTGWEELGEHGPARRERNAVGWETVGADYQRFIERRAEADADG